MKNKTRRLLVLGVMMVAPAASFAQEDPFAPSDPKKGEEKKVEVEPRTIRAVYEVFSLPLKEAAAIQRSGIDDGKFYQKMLEGLTKETVKQETFMVSRLMPGNQVKAFEGSEHIYHMEVEPPGLPSLVASTKKTETEKGQSTIDAFPVTPATPSAFETRSVGKMFELEASIDQEGKTIELRIASSEVSLIERDIYGQGMSTTEMPRFAAPGLRTGVTVLPGRPFYLGTISPPAELQPKEGGPRVWFAFVTASTAKL